MWRISTSSKGILLAKQQKPRHIRFRQKIRNTLHRLGMQVKASEVVEALAEYGVSVSEGFVERVRIEELKHDEKGGSMTAKGPIQIGKRHLAQKIPQKRPWRR